MLHFCIVRILWCPFHTRDEELTGDIMVEIQEMLPQVSLPYTCSACMREHNAGENMKQKMMKELDLPCDHACAAGSM